MQLGIGFLTVITAAITSTFVARSGAQPHATGVVTFRPAEVADYSGGADNAGQ